MGMMPIVIPAFWNTLKAMKANSPAQIRRPKMSRDDHGRVQHPPGDHAQGGRARPTAPTKPSCSPTAVKMKSVCCSGT